MSDTRQWWRRKVQLLIVRNMGARLDTCRSVIRAGSEAGGWLTRNSHLHARRCLTNPAKLVLGEKMTDTLHHVGDQIG